MVRPRKHPDEFVIDQAMEVFWANGWASTSMKMLEKALGLGATSIYKRFDSKEGLFVACLEHYRDTVLRSRFAKFLDPESDDPIRGLKSFTESAKGDSTQKNISGCLIVLSAAEANSLPQSARDIVDAALSKMRQLIAACVNAAVTSKLMRPEGAQKMADQIFLSSIGVSVLSLSRFNMTDLQGPI